MTEIVGESKVMPAPEKSIHSYDGAWRRGRLLGQGSFGKVHLAHFTARAPATFPPVVAVKSSHIHEMLRHEKLVYESLGQSPFIIRCFGDDVTVDDNGGLCLNVFLEYASGGNLYDHLMKCEGFRLRESEAMVIARSILQGIQHIHRAGFVHSDLKPENVLLVQNSYGSYMAKIGDFGLTKVAGESDRLLNGTDLYWPPECKKLGIQGQASDIWALGCILYSMLTGTMQWVDTPVLRDLAKPSANISKEAGDFVRQCLWRNPYKRPNAAMLLTHPFVCGAVLPNHARIQESVSLAEPRFVKPLVAPKAIDPQNLRPAWLHQKQWRSPNVRDL